MAYSHRNNDERECGAKTQVIGQDFVIINGQLWAVDQDMCDHGNGGLVSQHKYVVINGKGVICQGDDAAVDDKCQSEGGKHCDPKAKGYDDMVDVK